MRETAKKALSAARTLQTDGIGSDFDRFAELWQIPKRADRAALVAEAGWLAGKAQKRSVEWPTIRWDSAPLFDLIAWGEVLFFDDRGN
ncbi:MAG: hypothetical protein JWP89_5648 [Schlesneria sp.]|nr:hypothetical protein [Schlesneria sp.]